MRRAPRTGDSSLKEPNKGPGLLVSGMAPMFVGHQRRLFASYHIAEGNVRRGHGVVLCNPFGQEALRAHRLYRVLAERLARSGIDVMRFDYYGTGDSSGEDQEGELSGWTRDIRTVHDELLRVPGFGM